MISLLANDNDGNGNCDEYCEGSFVVSSEEDLQNIEICAYITGDITISYSVGFDINLLSNLTFIGGDLSIIGNTSLLNLNGFETNKMALQVKDPCAPRVKTPWEQCQKLNFLDVLTKATYVYSPSIQPKSSTPHLITIQSMSYEQ